MINVTFEKDKFKQALHYLILKTSGPEYKNVGKKVLHKLLYFNDFNYYERYELPMTGETYVKKEHGPFSTHFKEAISELEHDGYIVEEVVDYYNHPQTKYRAKESMNYTFSQQEMNNLSDTLSRYSLMNGRQIEGISHRDMPWVAAEADGILDYEFVFYRSDDLAVGVYSDDEN